MTTKELRIGNIILLSEDSTEWEVIGIHGYGVDVRNHTDETYIEIDQFEGIKITDDMLERAGIVLNEYFYKGNGTYWFAGHNPEVPVIYLHQLQNLFYILRDTELNFAKKQ